MMLKISRKKILLLLFFCGLTLLYVQNRNAGQNIQGIVGNSLDRNKSEYAVIILLNNQTDSLATGAVTNKVEEFGLKCFPFQSTFDIR